MRVVVVIPPQPVLSPQEVAEQHLKVDDFASEDVLIAGYIAAATAHIDGPDGWLGRSIGVQTLEARCDVFRDAMVLRYPPIIDIASVKYLDGGGVEQTVPANEYETRGSLIGSAFGKRWPSVLSHPESVRIQYRAGYEMVPAPILAAIMLMVGDLYRNRSTATEKSVSTVPMSTTVENLLSPFRVYA